VISGSVYVPSLEVDTSDCAMKSGGRVLLKAEGLEDFGSGAKFLFLASLVHVHQCNEERKRKEYALQLDKGRKNER
jgi:hypothetical protein